MIAPRPSIVVILRDVVRLAAPFYMSDERWAARGLLAAVIGCQLMLVAVAVRMNIWRNDFFQALQERSWDGFIRQFWVYCILGIFLITATVYQDYLNQWLIIRWRRWMIARLLDKWLNGPVHYRMQIAGHGEDNPDQRIAEDTRLFVTQSLALLTGFIGSVASFVSFVAVLWGLSAAVPLFLFGMRLTIPGYLVWAAVLYALAGTAVAHAIGRRLIPLHFEQEQREADFRFSLVRVRENAEPIALMRGEARERGELDRRFDAILRNWYKLIGLQKRLGFFAAAYRHFALYFPYLVISPLYFAGGMAFGALMQSGSAFNEVRSALSYFITAYPRFTELAAAARRLSGFEAAVKSGADELASGFSSNTAMQDPFQLSIPRTIVKTADGQALAEIQPFEVKAGERVLITGPSGIGKTSLVRAISGAWPYFEGGVVLEENNVMVVPQSAYLPTGTLRQILAYPKRVEDFTDQAYFEALQAVELGPFEPELDDAADWDLRLSPGQRQKLAIGRVILHRPDILILDEATSSLDEAAESVCYEMLKMRLPRAILISIGHRATLGSYHQKTIHMKHVCGR